MKQNNINQTLEVTNSAKKTRKVLINSLHSFLHPQLYSSTQMTLLISISVFQALNVSSSQFKKKCVLQVYEQHQFTLLAMIITICQVQLICPLFQLFSTLSCKIQVATAFFPIVCIYQVYFDLKEPFLLTTKRLPHYSFIFRKMLHKYIPIQKNSNANVHLTRFTFKSNSIGFHITYCTQ